MISLENWLNSGMYVYAVVSERGYQADDFAKTTWPDATIYGGYRLLNVDKTQAQGMFDYLVSKGFTPNFGISDTTPMLLTWDEAIQFASQFTVEEPTTAWPP